MKVTYLVLAVMLLCTLPFYSFAYKDGSFSRLCNAPNWQNGRTEPVFEKNVGDVLGGFSAFTSRQPYGRWLIQYNVPKMMQMSFTQRRFLFYHECAHATFNSGSEKVADCEGLRMMMRDSGATQGQIAEIAGMYRVLGRQFPPQGCRF